MQLCKQDSMQELQQKTNNGGTQNRIAPTISNPYLGRSVSSALAKPWQNVI